MLLHSTENITYQTARDSNTICDSWLDQLLQFKSRKVHNKLLKRVLKLKIYLSLLSEEMILATHFKHWILQLHYQNSVHGELRKLDFHVCTIMRVMGRILLLVDAITTPLYGQKQLSPAEAAKSSREFRGL